MIVATLGSAGDGENSTVSHEILLGNLLPSKRPSCEMSGWSSRIAQSGAHGVPRSQFSESPAEPAMNHHPKYNLKKIPKQKDSKNMLPSSHKT